MLMLWAVTTMLYIQGVYIRHICLTYTSVAWMHMSQDRYVTVAQRKRPGKRLQHVENLAWQVEALVELRDRTCRCLLGRGCKRR